MHPSVAIIGAGKIGIAIGKLLHDAGHPIGGVVCRSESAAFRAAKVIGDGIPLTSVKQGVKGAQWIFITVPDDALQRIAQDVSKHMDNGAQLIVHTSGVHGAAILSGPNTHHVQCLAAHPIQTVADLETGASRLKGSFWGLEGREDAVQTGKRLVSLMEGRPLTVQEGRKPLYHAAATMSSNYIIALIHIGVRLMETAGMDSMDALEAISTLTSGALSNVSEKGIAPSLTGPIERGDVATVEAHLNDLKLISDDIETIYRTLALYTLEIAREKHANRFDDQLQQQLQHIEHILR